MAKGSARQRKKIAKRLARKSIHRFSTQVEQAIKQNRITIEELPSAKIPAPIEEQPTPLNRANKTDFIKPKKKKKLTKKQRKKLKQQKLKQLQKEKQQRKQSYRDKSQEQYYQENPQRQYINEPVDMTEEYASSVIEDLNSLNDGYRKEMLLNIFYTNYRKWGDNYIQTLHDSGFAKEIHDTVEECVARYKGSLPDKHYLKMIEWLNIGLPADAREFDGEDNEDINSEVYE